jgi:hypothetical protein
MFTYTVLLIAAGCAGVCIYQSVFKLSGCSQTGGSESVGAAPTRPESYLGSESEDDGQSYDVERGGEGRYEGEEEKEERK